MKGNQINTWNAHWITHRYDDYLYDVDNPTSGMNPVVSVEGEIVNLPTISWVTPLTEEDFRDVRPRAVIGMVPGEIVTTDNGYADHVDLEKDILKIAVVERHKNTGHIGLGYIQGYGLKSGAVATSISHDSHNIIVVGTNAADMAFAANYIVENHGGIVVVKDGKVLSSVVLEIAGIMSDEPLTKMNEELEAAKDAAFCLGVSRGIDPFMTLSFMALPVIPTLRITTRGIIDVVTQQYI